MSKLLRTSTVIGCLCPAVTITNQSAAIFRELLESDIDRRKHGSAMILTSNRDINEWGEVFPESVLANCTIDRIFDRAITIPFTGPSYRLKGKIKMRGIDTDGPKT